MAYLIIDGYPVDLMVTGDLTLTSEITDHTVESGSDVSDNIACKPIELTTEGMISDTPIGDIAQDASRRSVDSATAADVFGAAFLGKDFVPLPSADAYEKLYAIWQNKRYVTVEIPVASRLGTPQYRVYQNMAIASLSVPTSKDSDGGLKFTANWKQLRFQTNRREQVRTSVPYGGGGKSASAVPLNANDLVLWRRGEPPGGPLPKLYSWYFVEQFAATVGGTAVDNGQAINTNGQTVGNTVVKGWRFTGRGDKRSGAGAGFDYRAGLQLNAEQLRWFYDDMNRDTGIAARQYTKAARSPFLSPASNQEVDTVNAQNADPNYYADHDQLPPGTNLDRFTPPADDSQFQPRNDVRTPGGSGALPEGGSNIGTDEDALR